MRAWLRLRGERDEETLQIYWSGRDPRPMSTPEPARASSGSPARIVLFIRLPPSKQGNWRFARFLLTVMQGGIAPPVGGNTDAIFKESIANIMSQVR